MVEGQSPRPRLRSASTKRLTELQVGVPALLVSPGAEDDGAEAEEETDEEETADEVVETEDDEAAADVETEDVEETDRVDETDEAGEAEETEDEEDAGADDADTTDDVGEGGLGLQREASEGVAPSSEARRRSENFMIASGSG